MANKKSKSEPASEAVDAQVPPDSNRKKPVRNPIRKLHMDKARLGFERTEIVGKLNAENDRHSRAVKEISDRAEKIDALLSHIESQIADGQSLKLPL